MSGAQDFVIENGVLKKYGGPGGDVVIPEEVKEIGSWYEYANRGLDVRQYGAFQYCETVRRVVIPASVKKIASYAFHNCTQLEEVEFQGEVSALGQNAFQGTPWLERQRFGNVYYVNGCAAGLREGAREAAVRPGTRCIVPEAFQGCGSLERISLPEGLTEIGDRAFSQCAHLSELALPESLKKLGREALRDCTGLRELKIPPNVSSIGAGAFAGCAGLERLDLSGAARQKKLSTCLCEGCASLREVLLPQALNYIGKKAFAGCRAWQSLALSGAVSVVSQKAFADCGLTRLTLGEGVERIERLNEPGVSNPPIFASEFSMCIVLPPNYPCVDAPVEFRFLTQDSAGNPIPHPWHPNIRYFGEFAGRVCLNTPDTYAGLDWCVDRVASYLSYERYHAVQGPPYPEDFKVAEWVVRQGEPNDWICFE